MTAFTPREVRAWAAANGVDCPKTGKIGRVVIDRYLAEVHGVGATPESAEPTTVDDDPDRYYQVNVTIPKAAAEDMEQLVDALLTVIMTAVEAGKTIERERIMAALA